MFRHRILSLGITVVAFASFAHEAHAAACDELVLDDLADDVILGEVGIQVCTPAFGCYFQPEGLRTAAACWRSAGGPWQLEILGCDVDTPPADYFSLRTLGGNDRVAALRTAHVQSPMFAMECEPGLWLGPWLPGFTFSTVAMLGAGRDIYHGSDGRDVVYSATPVSYLNLQWMSADNSSDMMCGWGGNDTLMGDLDDDLNTHEEALHGGNGSDVCDGDYKAVGSSVSDLYLSCETHSDADLDIWGFIQCTSNDDPLHEW